MNKIENLIRTEINRTSANTSEARNVVYLNARTIIKKLPPEKAQTAMNGLFEAVKTIEAEFVRADMKKQAGGDPSSSEGASAGFASKLRVHWKTVLIVSVLVGIMTFSTYLLLTELQKTL